MAAGRREFISAAAAAVAAAGLAVAPSLAAENSVGSSSNFNLDNFFDNAGSKLNQNLPNNPLGKIKSNNPNPNSAFEGAGYNSNPNNAFKGPGSDSDPNNALSSNVGSNNNNNDNNRSPNNKRDYSNVDYLSGGTDNKLDVNNSNEGAYVKFPDLSPLAGKIAKNKPYASVGDLYNIPGLTSSDKDLIRKYEERLTAQAPNPDKELKRVNKNE